MKFFNRAYARVVMIWVLSFITTMLTFLRSLTLLAILTTSHLALAQASEPTTSDTKLVKPSTSAPTKAPLGDVADLSTSGDPTAKRAKIPTPADDRRIEHILNDLAKQAGWFPDVKMSVTNGMVVIEGRAKNAEQLEWLARTADRLPSVIAVINKAEIETAPVTDLTPAWKEFKSLLDKAKRAMPLFALAFILFGIFWFLAKYISRGVNSVWGRHIQNPFLLSTVAKLTMIPIWILFFYLILQTAGLSALATTIIGGTGAVGIILGFAFKDIAGNYLSGLLLAMRSPFTKGDQIEVDRYEGFVQSLNMRGTTILDLEGNLVLIPNTIVIQSVIRNKTVNPETRMNFTVGIGYDDSFTKAQNLILETLKSIPAVLQDPSPMAVLKNLNSSTVDIEVYIWVDTVKHSGLKTKSSALNQIKEVLLANEITLPDSAREVVFTDALKVQMLASTEEVKAAELDRAETAKKRASANLDKTERNPHDTEPTEDTDLKKMGTKVDLLHVSAAKEQVAAPQDKMVKA